MSQYLCNRQRVSIMEWVTLSRFKEYTSKCTALSWCVSSRPFQFCYKTSFCQVGQISCGCNPTHFTKFLILTCRSAACIPVLWSVATVSARVLNTVTTELLPCWMGVSTNERMLTPRGITVSRLYALPRGDINPSTGSATIWNAVINIYITVV